MTGITPDITDVIVVRHGTLRLTFADGRQAALEVLDCMRERVFEAARTPGFSAKVGVDAETGTIVWPGGADLARTRSTSASALACGRIRGPSLDAVPVADPSLGGYGEPARGPARTKKPGPRGAG